MSWTIFRTFTRVQLLAVPLYVYQNMMSKKICTLYKSWDFASVLFLSLRHISKCAIERKQESVRSSPPRPEMWTSDKIAFCLLLKMQLCPRVTLMLQHQTSATLYIKQSFRASTVNVPVMCPRWELRWRCVFSLVFSLIERQVKKHWKTALC